ncbi:MAG: TIR domain-containing protein [Bacteroidota bacterium]
MSKKIFLSYALSDKELVEMFKEQLCKEEKEFEFLEHAVIENTEKEWKQNVITKIKTSDVFLCLFGFSTWESEAVKWEVEKAIENKKKVFLVKLKATVFMIPNYIEENNIKIFEEDIQEIANQIKFS